jgi:DNA repair exonuclease SbcCD nuclease subunit
VGLDHIEMERSKGSGDRPPRRRVSLLHTADLHLSEDPRSLEGLARVVETAQVRDVDAVLIAGDLFENARVGEEIVEFAISALAECRVPVVVIPGNHDCVDENSIYNRVDLARAGEHVIFVGDPEGREVRLPSLDLAIWARGIQVHHPGHRPLDGYRRPDAHLWSVVLTHGHFVPHGQHSHSSSLIREDEIAALGCDYVALGHWHRFFDASSNGVMAFYPGSPTYDFGDRATANLVVLDLNDGVGVHRVELGAQPDQD